MYKVKLQYHVKTKFKSFGNQILLSLHFVVEYFSKFSELSSESKVGNPLRIINQFLTIYEDVMNYNKMANSTASENSLCSSPDQQNPISLWVEAALATNLDVVTLVKSQNNNESPLSVKKSMPTRLSPRPSTKTGLFLN